MRVYLAAQYNRYPEMQFYATQLEAIGITVTSHWIAGDHEMRAQGRAESAYYSSIWAEEDLRDLLRADACISFSEGGVINPGRSRGGRHVEFGIALASNKRMLLVGYREHVFHWFHTVEFFPNWDSLLQTLMIERGIA